MQVRMPAGPRPMRLQSRDDAHREIAVAGQPADRGVQSLVASISIRRLLTAMATANSRFPKRHLASVAIVIIAKWVR